MPEGLRVFPGRRLPRKGGMTGLLNDKSVGLRPGKRKYPLCSLCLERSPAERDASTGGDSKVKI